MALAWFGGSREVGLSELIAQKKYAKAIEVLRAQFQESGSDPRMRLRLADVLAAAGRAAEAVPLYVSLADEFAREGFTGKAIAVLKKVQKIDPARHDIEKRLARLAKEKQTTSIPLVPPPGATVEIGMEEIGLEPHAISFAVADMSAPLPAAPVAPEVEPVTSEESFEEEFFDTLAETLTAQAAAEQPLATRAATAPVRSVASPLFDDFTEQELLAVMEKLDLVAFEPGDIVIAEGQPGDSLFVLTTGSVKAFVKNPSGRQVFVRALGEGSFFGEISILSGKPRTATITCATPCELLELDRAALDSITAKHPRVQNVLLEFYKQRHGSEAEQLVRSMSFGQANRGRTP
jgi:hypothetical protein